MEEQVMVTPHRLLSTCRLWDCRRFAALYCSLHHEALSIADANTQRAAICVDEMPDEEESDLTEKIFEATVQGHASGIPTFPVAVIQQNPWSFPQMFPLNRLENESTRNFIFLSDFNAVPGNIWQKYNDRDRGGIARRSWNLRPQPDVGRYRLRRYSSAHHSLFWLKYSWEKLNKKPNLTIGVPISQQEKENEAGPSNLTKSLKSWEKLNKKPKLTIRVPISQQEKENEAGPSNLTKSLKSWEKLTIRVPISQQEEANEGHIPNTHQEKIDIAPGLEGAVPQDNLSSVEPKTM